MRERLHVEAAAIDARRAQYLEVRGTEHRKLLLRRGARVMPLERNQEGWCKVQGIAPGGGDGWVWGGFIDACFPPR